MKSVGVASFALVLGLAAGPSFAQAGKTPVSQAKPVSAQPRPAPALGPPAKTAARPVARSVFIASMDAEFRKMDADKNGTVTRTEIEGFERAVSVVKAQAKNRQLFARLDTDRNGQLSAAEFSRLASPAPADAGPMLSRMDLNRDQSLTLIEYRTATLSNFDRMDSDKNGVVTPAEMKAAGVGR